MNSPFIKESFVSIQGEGKYAGVRQLFIRFSDCDINCSGCDTDFSRGNEFEMLGAAFPNPANLTEIVSHIEKTGVLNNVHSIAFTGGEPLLNHVFIKNFISQLTSKTRFFLETSGYHLDKLADIYSLLDIVSMDIKISSSFGIVDNIANIKKGSFIENQKTYFKLIISKNFSENELDKVIDLLVFKNFKEIFIHFKNNLFDSKCLNYIMDKFYNSGITSYYIPQIHKFLKVR